MVYYYEGVLIPLRQKEFQVGVGARGNWSDLYPRWLGTREFLLRHRNPYNPEVTRDIQQGFYGRVIEPARSHDPKDPQAFAYPLYVSFLLAPLIFFPFNSVRIVFTAILFLVTIASVVLWIRALGLQVHRRTILLAVVGTVCSFAVVDGLHLQQMTLLAAGLLAASLAALASGQLFWAGVVLGLASLKPQLVLLVIGFLLMWTGSEWRSRKWFAIGLGGSIAALVAGSEMLLPGWFHSWWQAMQAYREYVKPSLLHSLLGQRAGLAVGLATIFGCAVLFWKVRRERPGSQGFDVAVLSALVVTVLLLPNAGGGKYNQVLLLPAVLWLSIRGWKLTKRSRLARVTALLALNVFAWQWILASAVCFAVLTLHHAFEREATPFVASPELLVFLFPLTLCLVFLSLIPEILRWRPQVGSAQ